MNKEYECYRLIPSRTKKQLNDWFDNCIKDGRTKESLIFELCQEYDLYFDYSLSSTSDSLGKYIKRISMLNQYNGKKFKDSVLFLKENEIKNEYSAELLNKGLDTYVYSSDLNHKHNYNLNLLSALQNDQRLLLEKMKKAMEEDNVGTYKNLVQALKEITSLIQKEEWVQQWSKYSCDDIKYVAVWEQRGSDIRNHRKFEIKDEIELTMEDFIETISSNWDKLSKEAKDEISKLLNR